MEGLLNTGEEMGGISFHRQRRDLSWQDIKTFYDDKNNFAMYLVLPLIVLVYGGCAVIYCIARCRRYLKRKNRKLLQNGDSKETEPLEAGLSRIIHSVPVTREGASSSADVRISVDTNDTPMPWQVPGQQQSDQANNVTEVSSTGAKFASNGNAFLNKGFADDFNHNGERQSPLPPPSYDKIYRPIRPTSKPPPYEEKGSRQRCGSVEEIITLDATPTQIKDRNESKRHASGLRNAARHVEEGSRKAVEHNDEEREKARRLVRGDIPTQNDVSTSLKIAQKSTSITSPARKQQLQPQYQPSSNLGVKADPTEMARQAAQLLRLDYMGKQAGKKTKRLVFVAE